MGRGVHCNGAFTVMVKLLGYGEAAGLNITC